MRKLFLATLLVSGSPAWGFAAPTTGVWVDASAGGAVLSGPLTIGPAWSARVGLWHGPYDDAYAIGRFWGLGAGVGQAWLRGALLTVPTLEVRRGVDLLVVKTWVGLAGGPLLGAGPTGAAVRAFAGAKYRRHRFFGPVVRAEVGADVVDAARFHASLQVGVEWSAPWRRAEPEPPPSDAR